MIITLVVETSDVGLTHVQDALHREAYFMEQVGLIAHYSITAGQQ